jgi:hypothetical protein
MKKKEKEQLIEVWKVLEVVTVSLDRMGSYWLAHDEDAAKDALHEFMNPTRFEKISHARSLVVSMLSDHDPAIIPHLEKMSENESEMGYWNGPLHQPAQETKSRRK